MAFTADYRLNSKTLNVYVVLRQIQIPTPKQGGYVAVIYRDEAEYKANDPVVGTVQVPNPRTGEGWVEVDPDQPVWAQLYAHAKTVAKRGTVTEDGEPAPLFRNVVDV